MSNYFDLYGYAVATENLQFIKSDFAEEVVNIPSRWRLSLRDPRNWVIPPCLPEMKVSGRTDASSICGVFTLSLSNFGGAPTEGDAAVSV